MKLEVFHAKWRGQPLIIAACKKQLERELLRPFQASMRWMEAATQCPIGTLERRDYDYSGNHLSTERDLAKLIQKATAMLGPGQVKSCAQLATVMEGQHSGVRAVGLGHSKDALERAAELAVAIAAATRPQRSARGRKTLEATKATFEELLEFVNHDVRWIDLAAPSQREERIMSHASRSRSRSCRSRPEWTQKERDAAVPKRADRRSASPKPKPSKRRGMATEGHQVGAAAPPPMQPQAVLVPIGIEDLAAFGGSNGQGLPLMFQLAPQVPMGQQQQQVLLQQQMQGLQQQQQQQQHMQGVQLQMQGLQQWPVPGQQQQQQQMQGLRQQQQHRRDLPQQPQPEARKPHYVQEKPAAAAAVPPHVRLAGRTPATPLVVPAPNAPRVVPPPKAGVAARPKPVSGPKPPSQPPPDFIVKKYRQQQQQQQQQEPLQAEEYQEEAEQQVEDHDQEWLLLQEQEQQWLLEQQQQQQQQELQQGEEELLHQEEEEFLHQQLEVDEHQDAQQAEDFEEQEQMQEMPMDEEEHAAEFQEMEEHSENQDPKEEQLDSDDDWGNWRDGLVVTPQQQAKAKAKPKLVPKPPPGPPPQHILKADQARRKAHDEEFDADSVEIIDDREVVELRRREDGDSDLEVKEEELSGDEDQDQDQYWKDRDWRTDRHNEDDVIVAPTTKVFYSQKKISMRFRDGSSFGDLITDLVSGRIKPDADFLRLEALQIGYNHYVCLDNRRLRCINKAGLHEVRLSVVGTYRDWDTFEKAKNNVDLMSRRSRARTPRVRRGGRRRRGR